MTTQSEATRSGTSVLAGARVLIGRIPWRRVGLVVGAYLLCVIVFTAFSTSQGANPLTLLPTMVQSSLLDPSALAQTLLRAVPIGFAALAAAIPARAGLVNVGGEGQLIMGAVAATGTGLLVGSHIPGVVGILLGYTGFDVAQLKMGARALSTALRSRA